MKTHQTPMYDNRPILSGKDSKVCSSAIIHAELEEEPTC